MFQDLGCPEDEDSNELIINDIGQLSKERLWSHFKKYGEIQRVYIPKYRDTGAPRGFAFVTFDSVAEAQCAVSDTCELEVRLTFLF